MRVQVDELTVDDTKVRWSRLDFKDKWDLLVSRKRAAEIVGVSPDSLSSMSGRYADVFPDAVGKYGQSVLLVRSEVEQFAGFLTRLREQAKGGNVGKRTQRDPLKVTESERAHTQRKIQRLRDKIQRLQAELKDAQRDLRAEEDHEEILTERAKAIRNTRAAKTG